jgi:hypothetical protein
MFNGRYVFYSENFKLQLSSINLHNLISSLFRSLETCPSRSCYTLDKNFKTSYYIAKKIWLVKSIFLRSKKVLTNCPLDYNLEINALFPVIFYCGTQYMKPVLPPLPPPPPPTKN